LPVNIWFLVEVSWMRLAGLTESAMAEHSRRFSVPIQPKNAWGHQLFVQGSGGLVGHQERTWRNIVRNAATRLRKAVRRAWRRIKSMAWRAIINSN
jgi:hypothetical protein